MSRIRSIHPGLWTDEAFVSLGLPARLFLMGLWTEADDQGVFEWSPLKLKMRLAPADNCDSAIILGEIAEAGAIACFDAGGRRYGAIRNFQKYQRPKQPQIKFPLPDDLADYVAQTGAAGEKPARGTALGKMLCEAQDGKCFYCAEEVTFYRKKATSLEVDHKVPVSRGGEDDVNNLVAACKPCNSLKGAMTVEEFSAQFSQDFLSMNCREKRQSHLANGNSHGAKPEFANGDSGPKTQREEGGGNRSSEAYASGADAPNLSAADLTKAVWDNGKLILKAAGHDDRHAGSIIGRFRKNYSDSQVLTVLARCEIEQPSEPVEWMTKALQAERTKANGQSAQPPRPTTRDLGQQLAERRNAGDGVVDILPRLGAAGGNVR